MRHREGGADAADHTKQIIQAVSITYKLSKHIALAAETLSPSTLPLVSYEASILAFYVLAFYRIASPLPGVLFLLPWAIIKDC
jgi:hypothetical protein